MARSYKYTGTIHAIYPTQEFNGGFKKRIVVLKEINHEAKFDSYAAFEFIFGSNSHNDHTKIPDGFAVGEAVEVEFYTQARENKKQPGSWFVANRAVGMERLVGASPVQLPMLDRGRSEAAVSPGAQDKDLPF